MMHIGTMENKGASKIRMKVIVGYILIVGIMAAGLLAIYRNLVVFSDNRLRNEEHRELLLVGNTLSKLYEIESEQNLFTAKNAGQYFLKYDSIIPEISLYLDSLKRMTDDPSRTVKLDSIRLLIGQKRDNLQQAAYLLDSMRTAPEVTRRIESTYVPRALNREITDFLTRRNLNSSVTQESDTSVVLGRRKGFLDRVRNVFVASQDSTLVIENRSQVTANQFKVMVDTLINKVRYSERLDLQRQKKFELAFLRQLEVMSQTNRMLTARIDELLKGVEQEEMTKTLQLVMARERALSGSQQTLFLVSTLAVVIALIFGFLFMVDLNKSQRYRKELERSHQRISNLLSSREKLMLTISHDIKAPMSSILGYIELMEQEDDPDKRERFLHNMKNSGDNVLRLVSTLLDYHRIESGTWQLKETRFDLHTLTEETVQSFRPLAMHKELDYAVENRIPEKSIRYGDPYVIRQIMSNILSNAVKYTSRGKISISMQEEIRDRSDWFIFTVTDTGEGIDEAEQQLIFSEFYRLDNRGDHPVPIEGSGLGLAIIKGLVEVLQGEIHLISEKEKGSSFIVELPLKTEAEQADNPVENRSAAHTKGVSVLVVDDDITQLMMISEMLQKIKMDCVTERDPEKVITLLNHQKFDIIFIDIQMPHTNGFTLVEKVRAALRDSTIPLIALTARSDISADDIRDAGFSAYLAKPFSSHDLAETVRLHLQIVPDEQSLAVVSPENTTKGAVALIEFVKEDPIVSKAILQSFIDETTDNIPLLRACFQNNDDHAASNLSHKMLPLFRMMDNRRLAFLLSRLEKEKYLTDQEKDEILDLLKESVRDATGWVEKFSQG